MATNSNRDVRLGVEIETTGEESIRRLADDVRRLAKEGTDATPEFTRLAAELDRLADQSGALAGLQALTKQVELLSVEQAQAAATAEVVGTKYLEVRTRADALRAQQALLAEAVRDANLAVVKARGDLDTYSAGFTKAGKDTAEYATRQAQLARVLADAKVELTQQKGALEQLTPAVRAAVTEETKLGNQVELLAAKARDGERALKQRNAALEESRAAALAAGASTTDLARADAELLGSIQSVIGATSKLAAEQQEAAAHARVIGDLDKQNAAAAERLTAALLSTAFAYDKEEAALLASAQAAEKAAAADRDLIESKRQAASASEQLAAAQQRSREEIESELAALRDSEKFLEQYTAEKERASQEALEFVLSLEREEAAALEAAKATSELNTKARKLKEGEQYVRELAAAFDAVEAQAVAAAAATAKIAETAVAARQAGAAINEAFGVLGIRSIDAIEAEIRQTEQALTRLEVRARAGALGVDEIARASGAAEAKLARLRGEILQIQAAPTQFERINTAINGLITRFGALSAAVATVGYAAKPVLDATIALERTHRVLTTVTGSAEEAARQVEFLRVTAQRSGQEFGTVADSYAKFAASALQTGLSIKDTQLVFESVSMAAGNLGLSSDQSKRALEALSQMAAKGVVSMEELRQQLGDALPGVLPLLAKELGLTTAELNKVVEEGQLLASEAIPAIGRALRVLGTEGGKPVESIVAEFARLKNAVMEAATSIADGIGGTAVAAAFQGVAFAIKSVTLGAAVLFETVTAGAKQMGVILAAVVNLDFKNLNSELARIADESGTKLAGLAERADLAKSAYALLGLEVEETGVGLTKAAEAGLRAAGATDAQVRSLAQLAIANAKSIDQAEELRKVAVKLLDAKKDEVAASQRLVDLAGDEAASRESAVKGAKALAAATESLAEASAKELEAAVKSRAEMVDGAKALGQNEAAIHMSLQAYDKLIVAKTADAEKTQQQAAAARAAAVAAELSARALKDNSGEYEQLAEDVFAAEEAVKAFTTAAKLGAATERDVQRATETLALAKGKLVDALKDQESASTRVIAAMKAEAEFTKAQIELEITKLKIKRDELAATGQMTTARILENQIRDLELKLTVSATDAKRAEANEIIRSSAVKLDHMRAQGLLTEAIEQDLKTRIRQAQATLLQADAASENQKVIEKQNREIRNGTSATAEHTTKLDDNSRAAQTNTGHTRDNTTAKRDNAKAAKEAADEAVNLSESWDKANAARSASVEAGALTDTYGELIRNTPTGGTTRTAVGQYQPPDSSGRYELDVAETERRGSPVWVLTAAAGAQSLAADEAARASNRANDPGGFNGSAGYSPFGSYGRSQQPAQTPAPVSVAATYTTNVTIGGKTYSLSTASQAATDELIRALEEAYRAGGGG